MKNIIVREYLESLTESDELDYILPMLLEVMGHKIISNPRITKGLPQYGKDVVSIGVDKDGIRKRFYCEVKGGADKDVTTTTFSKTDGIRESIIEARDRGFNDASNPDFENLPIKIVLAHNGIIKANVKETFDGFIQREFPAAEKPVKKKWWKRNKNKNGVGYEFERWDIYELTELFTQHLFNEYLLTDAEATNLFKKVLVLLNTPRNNYADYFNLVNHVFEKAGLAANMGERKRLLFFETMRMISFIVYHYSKDAQNLNAAIKCIPYSVLRLWNWILENNLEGDAKVRAHFDKNVGILFQALKEYFERTLPVAKMKDGIWAPNGGRYEQVGYPVRAMDYIGNLILYFKFQQNREENNQELLDNQINDLTSILNSNDGTIRPIFDNHSIPVCLVLNFLIENGRIEDAKEYLRNVQGAIQVAQQTHQRLPDGKNRIESVIRYIVRRQKSAYYEDATSHLFGILLEYMAVLDMKDEYDAFKKFITAMKIDIAVFEPYDNAQLQQYQPDNNFEHEQNLLSHTLYQEGYQAEITLNEEFSDFQAKTFAKPVFAYPYKTQQSGYDYLLLLAHVYFKTPLFPSAWRNIRILVAEEDVRVTN